MLRAKDSSSRITKEFSELQQKNYPLAALMLDLADHVSTEFRKDVIVTGIFRTKEEQRSLYGANTKRVSPHMLWQAVDIRDWIYTDGEKAAICKFLKLHYDRTNKFKKLPSGSKTCWLHKVLGGAMHFHIQYKGALVYVFSQGAEIRGRPQLAASQRSVAVRSPASE